MSKPVVLVGFSGAGKTSVGKVLKERYCWSWLDVDEAVEHRAGKTITSIIREEGEQTFRALERSALKAALEQATNDIISGVCSVGVISIGGGALLNADSRADLKTRALSVWLKVSPEVAAKRIAADEQVARQSGVRDIRPILAGNGLAGDGADVEERVKALMAERDGLYSGADYTLNTDSITAEDAAAQVVKWASIQNEEQ